MKSDPSGLPVRNFESGASAFSARLSTWTKLPVSVSLWWQPLQEPNATLKRASLLTVGGTLQVKPTVGGATRDDAARNGWPLNANGISMVPSRIPVSFVLM